MGARVSGQSAVKAMGAARVWMAAQPPKARAGIGAAAAAVLLLLWLFINNQDYMFIGAEACHVVGICILIFKLSKDRSCAGLSLKSQELTALFLAFRLYSSYILAFDIHFVLDLATLMTTLWVIYTICFTLKSSYMEDMDNFAMPYSVITCALTAIVVHPKSSNYFFTRLLWAFSCNLETVSVMPQLRMMQNTKIVESLTAHYVFALGVARFLNCAHWVLQVVNTRGTILLALGYELWPGMVLLSDIFQTFIYADFCYYYTKSFIEGHPVLRLPSDIV